MIPIPSGVRVWIATRHPDMRRGMHPLGQTSDVLQAAVFALLEGLPAEVVVMADAAYDADHLRQAIAAKCPHLQRRGAIRIPEPVGGATNRWSYTECRCAVLEAKML